MLAASVGRQDQQALPVTNGRQLIGDKSLTVQVERKFRAQSARDEAFASKIWGQPRDFYQNYRDSCHWSALVNQEMANPHPLPGNAIKLDADGHAYSRELEEATALDPSE